MMMINNDDKDNSDELKYVGVFRIYKIFLIYIYIYIVHLLIWIIHFQSVFCQIMTFHNHLVPMTELVLFYRFLFESDCLYFNIQIFVYLLFISPAIHSAEYQGQYSLLCSLWILNSTKKLLQILLFFFFTNKDVTEW